jgi:hypothetical protein
MLPDTRKFISFIRDTSSETTASYMHSQAREHHGCGCGWADHAGRDFPRSHTPRDPAVHLVRARRRTDGVRGQPPLGSGGRPRQAAPGRSTEPSHGSFQPPKEILLFRQLGFRPAGLVPPRRRHIPRPFRSDPALLLAQPAPRPPTSAAGHRGHLPDDCQRQFPLPAYGTSVTRGGGQLSQGEEGQDSEGRVCFPATHSLQEEAQASGH